MRGHGQSKILVFAGSIRTGSFNARLAALAAKELTLRRCRRHADLARRLSDAALRRQFGSARRAARQRRQAQTAVLPAPRHVHRQPGIQRVGDAAAEEHARLGLARARGARAAARRVSRAAPSRSAGASNGTYRRDALADGAAPGARARLRRAGDPRADRGARGRASLRRDGQPQGRAHGRRAQERGAAAGRHARSSDCSQMRPRESSRASRAARPADRRARPADRCGRPKRMVERLGDAVELLQDRLSARLCGRACRSPALIGAGKHVFLDLKLHDIGNTVARGRRERRAARRDLPDRACLSADHAGGGRGEGGVGAAHSRRDGADLL